MRYAIGMSREKGYSDMKYIDLTGQRYGKLTVIRRAEPSEYAGYASRVMWVCKCDCGNECIIPSANLKTGNTKSCGCVKKGRKKVWVD